MTTKYFNVKVGLTTGNITLDATSGNITTSNAALGNLATANYFSGNGSLLTAIAGSAVTGQVGNALVAGTVYNPSQTAITSVGTLTSLSVTGNVTGGNLTTGGVVSATGNVSGGNLTTSGAISATGNISGGNVSGTYLTGTLTTASQPNVTSVGTLTGLTISNGSGGTTNLYGNGVVISSGNIIAPYFVGNFQGNISGNIVVPGTNTNVLFNNAGNAGASGSFTFDYATNILTLGGNLITGNANLGNLATANYHKGDGSLLTNITGGNVTGQVGNALVAGTVYSASQPSITSVGTLTSLTVSGNVTGGNIDTAGVVNIHNTLNSTGTGTGALIVTGGASVTKDLYVGGTIYAPNYAYVNSTTLNANAALLYLTAEPHYPYNYDIGFYSHFTGGTGNVYQHTGLVRNHSDSAWYLFSNAAEPSGGTVDLANANLVFDTLKLGNLVASGSANAASLNITGNIVAGNANLGNLAFANYHQGNGYLLTSINASNISGQVANALVAGTVYTAAQPSITSVGSLTGLTMAANANITLSGSLSQVSGANLVSATYVTGTLTTASQPNITSTGTLTSLTVSGTTNLGAVGNVTITGGTSGYLLSTNGSGGLSFIAPPSTTGITNGTSNVSIPASSGNVNTSVGGTANVLVVTGTGANIAGTLNATGNIIGGSKLLVGTGTSSLTNPVGVFQGSGATYTQVAMYNSIGTGSADIVTYGNNGDDTQSWADMGFTGNSFSDANYTVTAAGDGYFFVQGNASFGGNMVIATGNVGTTKDIIFATGGFLTGNIKARLYNANGAFSVTGNVLAGNVSGGNLVSANYVSGNGSLLTSITGGNVTGQVANALVAGTVYTAAQPAITSVGTLTGLTVSGNTVSGNVKINGGLLSNRSNISVTSSDTIIDQFPTGSFRSAKYYVTGKGTNGYQSAEILLVQDGTNSYITIYGSICSNNTADLLNFSSNIDGVSGNVRVYANSASASTTVNLIPIYLND